jgi:hypothetical protein
MPRRKARIEPQPVTQTIGELVTHEPGRITLEEMQRQVGEWTTFGDTGEQAFQPEPEPEQIPVPRVPSQWINVSTTTGATTTGMRWDELRREDPSPIREAQQQADNITINDTFGIFISELTHVVGMNTLLEYAHEIDRPSGHIQIDWNIGSFEDRVQMLRAIRERDYHRCPLIESGTLRLPLLQLSDNIGQYVSSSNITRLAQRYNQGTIDFIETWRLGTNMQRHVWAIEVHVHFDGPIPRQSVLYEYFNQRRSGGREQRTRIREAEPTPRIKKNPIDKKTKLARLAELKDLMLEAKDWNDRSVLWDEFTNLHYDLLLYFPKEYTDKYKNAPYKGLYDEEEVIINFNELADAIATFLLKEKGLSLPDDCVKYNELCTACRDIILNHKRNKDG